MRSLTAHLLPGLMLLGATLGAAHAQAQPVITPYMTLNTGCVGSNPRVIVEVGLTSTTNPDITGFDLFRGSPDECGELRITDAPLPRGVPGHYTFQVDDSVDASNKIYRYVVRAVNATRQPVEFSDTGPDYPFVRSTGWSTCNTSPALIGTGTITTGPGFPPYFFNGCADRCASFFNLLPDLVTASYADTGEVRRFYGSFAGCGIEGCDFIVDFSVPATCIVEISPSSWSAIKSRY
jgi:hypothetical protein